MKTKNLFPIILLFTIIAIAIFSIIWSNLNLKQNNINNEDFTPEEEINLNNLSKTNILLYYLDPSSSHLKSEGRNIDSKELLENPYKKIIEYLIDGPKSDNLKKVFPDNVKLLNATIEENCVTLNFSEELLNFENNDQMFNIINSILNSLTELNEVESIKILVNGESIDTFNEQYFKIH